MPGEKTSHVKNFFCSAFAIMGVPAELKTDNGPAYNSHACKQFCKT